MPATRGSLTAYVKWRWLAGHAPATIERAPAGIAAGHAERSVQIDRAATRQARTVLAAEIRAEAEAGHPPRGRRQAPPLTLAQLQAMLRACPDTPAGLQDQALLLVGVGIAARRGELASLRARHIVDLGDALRVTIPYGKRGGRTVTVSSGEHELTDPVQARLGWAAVADLDPDEPALLQTTRWGGIRQSRAGMGDKAISEHVQACGERAGVEGLSGHTLRVSLATLSRQAGKRTEVIADQGGWMRDSRALLGYIHIVDELIENATVGIGL
ncbi:tyrosine-type recombinase/integrase [Spirillospora sp. NPDC046719]